MRAIVLVLLCISFTLPLESQELQVIDGIVTMQEVAEIPGMTQEEIYAKVKNWFATRFKNAESVIQSESASMISGTYARTYEWMQPMYNRITIDIQDERLRYTVDHIRPIPGQAVELTAERWLLKRDGTWEKNTKRKAELQTILSQEFNDLADYVKDDDW